MISQEMQLALKAELELHDGCHDLPLCLYLTVVAACYVSDTVFEEELWDEAKVFLLDEIMMSCILKGAVEPSGVNEDGEMMFGVTDWGIQQMEKSKKKREEGI